MNNYQKSLLQDRFGLKVASRLSDALDVLPYEISERLRSARMQALGKRKTITIKATSSVLNLGGSASLSFGSGEPNWWDRVATVVPLLLLIVGLIAINLIQDDNYIKEIADIDAALLTDDLPPMAYTDPGFAHFLKISSGHDK